ncbi:MAG: hypothetical protein HOK30_17720 [Rhodospirillaceae bacterium]|jgi:hypothetical protein|nr:hypothetical protein [Rhodospirillaceae bacterium]MBT5049397.1 hypothetical protein [Rhodospirillaceae bacterium]MBT5895859.1 hypothetical protein [Rhodospirillaceae bacterium]MBT6429510.1 hypothetical protein [Rhodospirillaceae bacterium]
MAKETDLYAPVKAMLEAKGYTVKAEVNGCDVVAAKDGAPTVIVELKLAFTLDLVLQGIQRQSVTDDVYLAVLAPNTATKRKNWRGRQRGYRKLCRMLGLGLMVVDPDSAAARSAEILLDPAPYTPRKDKRRQTRLLTEFVSRDGDPNTGGINRTKIITAYRQDALRCAQALRGRKAKKVADIKATAGVPKAASILQKNHYDWFERTARGVYRLTPTGREGLKKYASILQSLDKIPK